VKDRDVSEDGLVSRQIRGGITANGEAGGQDSREIDMNTGDREDFADARHDVTTILCGLAWALPNNPNARDTHRIRRERDEPSLLR